VKDCRLLNKQHRRLMRRDSNLKKLSVLEVRKEYQIIISKRLAGLENLMIVRTKIGLGNNEREHKSLK